MKEYNFDPEKYTKECIEWIRRFFDKNNFEKAILGISGGKDSSVVAALCSKAIGNDNVIGVMLPNGEQKDISDSKKIIEFLNINSKLVNISDAYNAVKNSIQKTASEEVNKNLRFATNTPSRLRMVILYGICSLEKKALVANTCNLSEEVLGYSTFFGDSCGDFAPINSFTVSEVMMIGDYLGLPHELVHKTPSDGMCGSSDEEALSNILGLRFSYKDLDNLIRKGYSERKEKDDKEFSDVIKERYNSMKYKSETIQIKNYNSDLPNYLVEK